MHPITCIVLAGGKGTRAVSGGDRTPKIARPLRFEQTALALAVSRALCIAAEVIVAVGPMRQYLSEFLIKSDRLTVTDDPGSGNAGALIESARLARCSQTLVMNADTINDTSYSVFVDAHLKSRVGASILLSRSRSAQHAGAYHVGSEGQVLHSMEAKISATFDSSLSSWRGASTGILIFPTRELRLIRVSDADTVEGAVTPLFIEMGRMQAFNAGDIDTLDLGTPERISRARELSDDAFLRRD